MKVIEVFIPSLLRSGQQGRGAFTTKELQAHGLEHPSDRQIRDVLSRAPGYLWPSVLFLAAFLIWDMAGFMFLAVAWTVRYLSPVYSAWLEHRNFHRWNRPDVFIGWNYSAIKDDMTLPGPPMGVGLIECMKPAWGGVLVIPPADPTSVPAILQQISGNRGVFLPCLVVNAPAWQPAVTWLLTQTRAAVFEIAEEDKKSLVWEIGEAIRILGPERVLLVRRGSKGVRVVTAAGQSLVRPAVINTPPINIARMRCPTRSDRSLG